MSYDKAMRHTRNVRKVKKQANNYMGFDAGSGRWPAARSNPYMEALLNVRDWFKERNFGGAANRKHTRECIREAIATAREERSKADARRSAVRAVGVGSVGGEVGALAASVELEGVGVGGQGSCNCM